MRGRPDGRDSIWIGTALCGYIRGHIQTEIPMKKQALVAGMLLVVSGAMATLAAETPDGKEIYLANCKKCHGESGTPSAAIKKMNPKIEALDAAFFAKRTEADLVKQITEGKDKMKPFKDKLKPEEIVAVAKYMRTLAK
jgi:mono/diheme cytochrome c family protein